MGRIDQEGLKKTSNKVGLLFIFQILSLMIITSILSKIGIYNQSNGFIFNMSTVFIVAYLLFPCDFKGMFLRKNKINLLEGFLYIFLLFSIYWPLTIIITNLLSPIYSVNMDVGEVSLAIIILQGMVIPVVEEVVYRGILMENLKKYGDIFAVVISALMFGMMHGSRLPYTFLAGIFMGILYIKSNSLVYPILMHIFNNLFFSLFIDLLEDVFNIYNMSIAYLILAIICMIVTSISYIIAKKNNSKEIENIKICKIRDIFQNLKQDKEKYKVFFGEGGVIFALVLYFIVLWGEINIILSKLKYLYQILKF